MFGPSVAVAPGGRRATLVFAGFHTANASQDFSDYRQIGRVTLELVEASSARLAPEIEGPGDRRSAGRGTNISFIAGLAR